jgi:hypothetical protein
VLGHPALAPPEIRADAKSEALLSEKGVAAVSASDRPDRVVLGEMADEPAVGIHVERAVEAAVEVVRAAERVERALAHARHDSHVQDDVDAVRELHAELRHRGAERPHDVRHDVQRAADHRAVEEPAELPVPVFRRHPVVRRSHFLLRRRADEGELLGAGDVVRVGAMEIAARQLLLVQRDEDSEAHGLFGQGFLFGGRSVAPDDSVGLREPDAFFDPREEMGVPGEGSADSGREG